MEKRLAYAYGRALVLSRIVYFLIAFALVGALLVLAPSFPAVPAAAFLGALLVAFLLFAVSPLLTQRWLTRSRLILRQGWYFRAIIPFSDIVGLEAPQDASIVRVAPGIHRPLGQPTLYVTGGRAGLLVVRLSHPRRFWSSFGLAADQIVFDVDDPIGFLRAYTERRTLLPPVQADRPNAELRD